ncbi:MAG: serine/threonine protein kinase [Deltaproteobacteria bacterium]|nr:serine/threonine protein kinase [Deltaproteobacteria bacterium]
MAPHRFGRRYDVLARLATGGQASVFLARAVGGVAEGELVALKVLLAHHAAGVLPDAFLREAAIASRLDHEYCARVYEAGIEHERYFLAMEYARGQPLNVLLALARREGEGLAPEIAAASIALAALGLHHAHELVAPEGSPYELIHRDVSPDNLVVCLDGRTKVLDFGTARAPIGSETEAGIIKGKIAYMSPEQITGKVLDRRTDIYSLGLVLYECLINKRVYVGLSPAEVTERIFRETLPDASSINSRCPRALTEVCRCALARSPSDRFTTAGDMASALLGFLGEEKGDAETRVREYLESRWGQRQAQQRSVLDRAARGVCPEDELLSALGARQVMSLDLSDESGDSSIMGVNDTVAVSREEVERAKQLPSVEDPTQPTPAVSADQVRSDPALRSERMSERTPQSEPTEAGELICAEPGLTVSTKLPSVATPRPLLIPKTDTYPPQRLPELHTVPEPSRARSSSMPTAAPPPDVFESKRTRILVSTSLVIGLVVGALLGAYFVRFF